MGAVQPIADELFAGAAFRLSNLSLVMWKQVIDSAAMDIDFRAKEASCHGATFDVPARPASTPRAIPTNWPVLCIPGFPEREITETFFFVFVALDSAGGTQFV